MSKTNTPFTLTSPCANCPFRSDRPFYLSAARAQEIAHSLYEGSTFHCHKTVDYDTEDGEPSIGNRARVCAGALITMEKEGTANQMMRIGERLGLYDRCVLDMDSPVYASLGEWVQAIRDLNGESVPTATSDDGEVIEYEHCETVGPGCIDPAGYSDGSGVRDNIDPPTCNPLNDVCMECGVIACAACRNDTPAGTVCVYCAEEHVG